MSKTRLVAFYFTSPDDPDFNAQLSVQARICWKPKPICCPRRAGRDPAQGGRRGRLPANAGRCLPPPRTVPRA